MCVCVHVCMGRGCCATVCIWKQEENAECFPPSLSTLFFEAGSLTKAGGQRLAGSWPGSPRDPPVFTRLLLGLQKHATMASMLSGCCLSKLMSPCLLGKHYQLSRLPSPNGGTESEIH